MRACLAAFVAKAAKPFLFRNNPKDSGLWVCRRRWAGQQWATHPATSAGSPLHGRFLLAYLNQDDDKYSGYWIARRHIGKGAPPREISGSAAVIKFVTSTPGAIGYIDAKDIQPNLNVLFK